MNLESLFATAVTAGPPIMGILFGVFMIAREVRMSIQTLVRAVRDFFSSDDGFGLPLRIEVVHLHKREPSDQGGRRGRGRPGELRVHERDEPEADPSSEPSRDRGYRPR